MNLKDNKLKIYNKGKKGEHSRHNKFKMHKKEKKKGEFNMDN